MVIFDLGKVLIKTNRKKIIFELSKYNLAHYWLVENKKLTDLQNILFSIMEKNHGEGKHSIYPALFEDWLLSRKTNETISRIVTRDINNSNTVSYHTKKLLLSLTKIMFDPVKFAEMMDEHSGGVALLKMMPPDVPLYLISNYDSQAFDKVRNRFPDTLRRFRDFLISGKENLMKPEKNIYDLAMKRWGITDPSRVLYIDDERDNVQMAKSLGFETVLFTDFESAILSIKGIIQRGEMQMQPRPIKRERQDDSESGGGYEGDEEDNGSEGYGVTQNGGEEHAQR